MTGKPEERFERKAYLPWLLALLIAIAGLLLVGRYLWFAGAPPAVALSQVIIATNTAYVGTCPIIAAREKGFFTAEGIAAVVQAQSSGKAAMEAMAQGQADLATVADIPIMFAGLNGRPISVIATLFKAEQDHGIVGRKDKGITTLANLKGKRIGVTLNTSGHFALDALLNRQRLSSSDVTMRAYPPGELAAALAQGEVDAVATWEPFLDASLTQLAGNGVVFYGQDVYTSLYNVAGKRDYVVGHPDLIRKVLRALTLGVQFCSENADEARLLVAAAARSDAAKLKAAWPSYRFNMVLDQGLLLALEDEARWAIKNKLTNSTEIPNYLDYIYLDGLEAVTPSAVTIIH